MTTEQIENRYYLHGLHPLIKFFVFEYLTGGGIDPDLAGDASLADLSALIVEGRVMRDGLVADLRELDNVAVSFASSRFEAYDSAFAAAAYRARPDESMSGFVARVAREHDFAWIIAPECDGLLLRLNEAAGAERVLGCTQEAIRLASSKRRTCAMLASQGIATTRTLDAARPPSSDALRWIVKPDDGAGGLDTCVYDHHADACIQYASRMAAGRDAVLQEWVEGEPLSLSLVCNDRGAQLVSINRQRIGLSDAAAHVLEFSGVEIDCIDRNSARGTVLGALAQRVYAALPGLRGFVGIDLVWHAARGPVVIEVNPRLTAAYAGLSAKLGRNLAIELLAAHGVSVRPVLSGAPS